MATRKFGKLKINTDEGLAFRFGDGKIHRLGRKNGDESEYEENMYEDDGYEEEDRGYTDDYSDDGYYEDDDYNDEYPEDSYNDDYNDRYSDEDAGDYEDSDEGEYLSDNPVMRFLEESDWPTYVLLVLLPPLGIWLLWHRRRFEKTIRYAVSGASLLWFVIVMILLFSRLFSGSGDTTISGNITMTTPVPTVTISATSTPRPADVTLGDEFGEDIEDAEGTNAGQTLADQLAADATPTATALAGANGQIAANSVYMTQTGTYYHNNVSCEALLAEGNSVSTVTTDIAIERGKSPCPVCYPDQKLFYATSSGKYYHVDPTCSGMKDASTITEEAAKAAGKKPCPACITGDVKSLGTFKFIDANTKDKSGINVYATKDGTYFHTEADCSGMKNPSVLSLGKAIQAGKKPCDKCAKSARTKVWCTEKGKYYHNKSDCSGMEGAYNVTLAEALIMGKRRCSTCWGNSTNGIFTSNATATGSTGMVASNGKVYVYATKEGTYYHTKSTCSGMKDASRIELDDAIKAGKIACPHCCSGAERPAYVTSKGTYYHSEANCSGMRNAKTTTVAAALADGYKQCPVCWGGAGTGTGNGTTVYATKNGQYYHTKSNCSGMKGASAMTLEQAVKAGKTACSTCASAANRTVYSTDGGKYYHSKKDCSGMTGAKARKLEEAVMLGQTACPTCIGTLANTKIIGKGTFSKAKAKASSGKKIRNVSKGTFSKSKAAASVAGVKSSSFSSAKAKAAALKAAASSKSSKAKKLAARAVVSMKSGKSGIKVYATAGGKYYHTKKAHAGAGASKISLETAIKYGKSACPTCSSTAGRTVYASVGGKYYHYYKAHAGKGAYSGKLSYALAMGLDPCPTCVKYAKGKIKAKSLGSYKAGTSGIKVYASIAGKYYHVSKSCAGASAAHVSLETALNYGKTACPSCTSLAKKTVYASPMSKYYHSSKAHAGAGATKGTLAAAMAAGLKGCPVCIHGSEAYETSDIKYSASGDTSVYIDLSRDLAYYHRTAKCSDAGMKHGTRVQLEFVLHWGYKACPYCNPPTSVSK